MKITISNGFFRIMYITTPSVAWKLISALGTDFFWLEDVFITGVGAERAKVPLVDLHRHFTFIPDELRCCLQGGGCEFLVASAKAEFGLIEKYQQLTLSTGANRKGRGGCVAVTGYGVKSRV
jgi:hypothetical protein